jgi:hypothetical protein
MGFISEFPGAGDQRRLERQHFVIKRDQTEGVCLGKHSQAGLDGFAGLCYRYALHGSRPIQQNHHAPRRLSWNAETG